MTTMLIVWLSLHVGNTILGEKFEKVFQFQAIMQEVDSSLIKEVQTNLGKYLKKPPLNEKLLKKPPFRYLHDIITSIIQETGFLEGLFTEDELFSNNVKDKNAKLKFLDKLIAALEKVTGKDITARSAKIIAGLEVNKTLELLLIIAKAIDNEVDCSAIVKENVIKEAKKASKSVVTKEKKTIKVNVPKNKEKKTETTPKNTLISVKNTEKKTSPKGFSVENSYTLEEKEKNQGEGTEEQSIEVPKTSSEPFALNEISGDEKKGSENEGATPRMSIEKRSASSGRSSGRNKSSPVRQNSIKGSNARLNSIRNSKEEVSNNALKTRKNLVDEHKEQTLEENSIENHTIIDEERDKSETHHAFANEGMARRNLGSSRDKEKEHSIVQRPSSARPGSRRFSYSNSLQKDDANLATLKDVKLENKKTDNGKEVHSLPLSKSSNASRPPSARPGAPRIRDRGEVSATDEIKTPVASVNVIEEGKFDQFHDEKENFVVIESEKNEPVLINHSSPINEQEQGKLVDQILKTQKELNDSVAVDASKNKHSEIEWEIGKQRERDIVIKETDKIRNFIQTLTSAANPLGKLFDFLQEDVDEMQRELQHWKKINETLHKQQSAEIEFGKTFLLPLQKQLEEMENSIQEEYLHITNIKHNILINDDKILKLLSNTNKTLTK